MHQLPKEITALFDAVLASLSPVYPDSFIGGGAIRDSLHGKKFKDIDVFTWCEVPEELRATVDDLNPFAPDDTMAAAASEPCDSDGSPRIKAVRKPIIWEGHWVQVIQLDEDRYVRGDINRVTKEFSIGLSQCSYCRGARVPYLTEGYAIDQAMRRFTVLNAESLWEMQRALRKTAMLHSKYPDHELVVPSKYLTTFTLL